MRPGWVRLTTICGPLAVLRTSTMYALTRSPGCGPLERHLLGLRQQRLDAAEVEQRVAAVGLLDDAGDDVALAVGVLLELAVALDLADALAHHLAERLGGDAAELLRLRRVVALVDPVAVLVEVVGGERELHRVAG